MKKLPILFAAILFALLSASALSATCGGGGGGGTGGMNSMGIPDQVYNVPWGGHAPEAPPVNAGLVLYWFPSSAQEVQKSSLRTSRVLSLYAAQCVSMEIIDESSPLGKQLAGDAKLPVAVLATPDGKALGKTENQDGFLRAGPVEKLVDDEIKRRENSLEQQLKQAKERAKSGDNAGAIPIYRAVLEQKCLFPKKAKDASKELKKLGVTDIGEVADPPNFDPAVSARIERTMRSIWRPRSFTRRPILWTRRILRRYAT